MWWLSPITGQGNPCGRLSGIDGGRLFCSRLRCSTVVNDRPNPLPTAELSAVIGLEYEVQCRQLCYGAYPSWKEVLARYAP